MLSGEVASTVNMCLSAIAYRIEAASAMPGKLFSSLVESIGGVGAFAR
jgi:hypothetical protein